jgi:hypothetical protein
MACSKADYLLSINVEPVAYIRTFQLEINFITLIDDFYFIFSRLQDLKV